MADPAMERCPACGAHVDGTAVVAGGVLRCEKCGMRFPRPRKLAKGAEKPALAAKDDVDGLGIHPALARKYRKNSGEGPSMPGVSAPPEGHDPPERATEIEPARRMSMEARTPLPSDPGLAARSLPESARLPAAAPKPQPVPPPRPPEGEAQETPIERRAPAQAKPRAGGAKEDPLPVVPGYEILELIGKGAMGRVWKGRSTRDGALAAIKVLAPELAARQDFIARFEREAAAIRAVNHPGVVAILDAGHSIHGAVGSEVHEPYFCMEYVEGQPLRRELDRGPLSPDRALHYARLIVQGLGAAHARGVIHRDLKPENILVVHTTAAQRWEDDRLVLVDFGLAGIVDEENDPHPNLTKSRMTMGTVNYMAPEQRTDAKRVDHRADLYAAGVILYELLTGDLPLGRFALPTEKGLKLPPSIDRVIVTGLARQQDERFQNADAFDQALAAIEVEIGSTAMKRAAPSAAAVVEVPRAPAGPAGPPPVHDTPVTGKRPRVLSAVDESAPAGSSTRPSEIGELPDDADAASGDDDEPQAITRAPYVKSQVLAWSVGALLVGTLVGLVAFRPGCGDAPSAAAPVGVTER